MDGPVAPLKTKHAEMSLESLHSRSKIGAPLSSGQAMTWAVGVLAFFIPLVKNGIQIPIILLGLVWLLTPKGHFKSNWKVILLFSAIYLFHILAMAYTDNLGRGLNDLEQKFSLLLFPLMIGSVRPFSSKERFGVLLAFVAGTFLSLVDSFFGSATAYQDTGDVMQFYMSNFSSQHHPSYVAMYVNFAVAFVLIGLFSNRLANRWRWVGWTFVAICALVLVFPASKMGFINFLVLVLFMLFYAYKTDRLLHRNTLFLMLVGIGFLGMLKYDPIASRRLSEAARATATDQLDPVKKQTDSSIARMHTWRIGLQLIAAHPFGVGTGDIADVLVENYRSEGLDDLAEAELNPHNSFIQIAIAQGIPALMVFLFSLGYAFWKSVRQPDWLYAFFLISIALNFMVESMLEKQSGVIFFAFFNAFLFFSRPSETHKHLP